MKRADLRGGRNQPVPGCHPRSDRIMPRQVQSREQSGEQDPLSGASTSLVGLVVAGQDLGDDDVPQVSLRRRPAGPCKEGSRGDLAAMLTQHAADRRDPDPSTMLGDESTDDRCCGPTLRTR